MRLMLASPASLDDIPRLDEADEWSFEEKYDGIRAVWHRGRLLTRTGVDITARFPEITDGLPGDIALDGEIVVPVVDQLIGRWDFTAAAKRAQGGHDDREAMYVVFDAPTQPGPLDSRRLAVSHAVGRAGPNVWQAPVHQHGTALMEHMRISNGEGVVVKDDRSLYRPGRSKSWLKIKFTSTITCAVTGYEPGQGSRNGRVGALTVALIDGTDVVPVGKVGSGFNTEMLDHADALLHRGRPFCVEVRFSGFTPGGKLRHPVLVRLRPDADVLTASMDQVGARC